jgi:hypothetical protein
MTQDEIDTQKQFDKLARFKEADPAAAAKGYKFHDEFENSLKVFDFEDAKDAESAELDNKFIRLGRFKQVPTEQFKETDPVPGLAPAPTTHKESK